MTRFTNTLGMSYNSRLLSGALINGKWLPGSAGTFTVNDPHTGTALQEVGRASPTDVDRPGQAAKAAVPASAGSGGQKGCGELRAGPPEGLPPTRVYGGGRIVQPERRRGRGVGHGPALP